MSRSGKDRKAAAGMVDPAITLRGYQSEAIHRVFAAWRDGHRSVVLVAPTASGKRYLALWLMRYAANSGRKVLFVGNRRLLIHQAADDAHKFGVPFGVVMADCLDGYHGASNQLASLQTLSSRYLVEDWQREPGQGLPEADLVIVDEAHAHVDKYQELLSFYQQARVLLLTATPIGAAGRSIVPKPYEVLIEGGLNSELITAGWLRRTTVIAPSEPDLQGVKLERISDEKLGRVVHKCTLFGNLFNEWSPFADRKTVVFAPGVSYGGGLVEQFNRRLGLNQAHIIEAKTKPAERARIFADLREGKCKLVISVGVLREGWDEPCVSCAIDVQPRSQLRDYWQKIGRIKRDPQSIQEAIYLDMAGEVWRHGIHPDEDPKWPIGEHLARDVQKAATGRSEPSLIICPKCKVERRGGSQCPSCGFQWDKPLRWIRMGNGKLQQITAKEVQKVEKTESERLFGKWQSRLFAALHSGMSYAQAARLYHTETGEYPREGWVFVFPKDSLDWRKKPKDYLTTRDLMIACKRSKK